MRTTLTIEDEIAARLKELMHRRKTTFKAIVNDMLRDGLDANGEQKEELPPFEVEAWDMGLPADLDIKQMLFDDDLERYHRVTADTERQLKAIEEQG